MSSLRPHHVVSVLAVGGIVLAAAQFGGSPGSGQPLFQNLDQFALFAEEEIKLEQDTQVSSGDIGSNKTLDIQKDAIVNGNLFADKLTIDKDSQVNGNASFNKLDIKRESQILGTQTKPVQLPIALLPEIPDSPIGTEDKKFTGKNNVLEPGSYRDITIEKDASVILPFSGATYNIRKLELKEGATLLFSKSDVLNIKEELKAQQNVSIIPAQNGLEPKDLTINYADKKPVEFGKRAFLTMKLLAPKADVHIGEETTLRRQVLARKVRVGKGGVMSNTPTGVKIATPAEIVTDPDGGVYPINIILVSLTPGATIEDALKMAQAVNGRIVGVVSSVNLYQVAVQTRTITEIEAIITNLRGRADLGVDGVFRDYFLPIDI